MAERSFTQACGCPGPPPTGLYGLLEPASELLIELDGHNAVVDGFPHVSALIPERLCHRPALRAILGDDEARLVVDRARVVRAAGQPTSFDLPRLELRARIAPHELGVLVLLRAPETRLADALTAATTHDRHFWQLFDAAPMPLAIEMATTTTGEGATRFNRKFTEVFGYDALDVPTVQHWWPLAYPDPAYRDRIRDEWFRRVSRATVERAAIEPMEATVTCKDGSQREIEFFAASIGDAHVVVFSDLSEAKQAARRLGEAQAVVDTLAELLPVCAWCKKLRDDQGYWQMLEEFLARRTGVTVTHGICPDCRAAHFSAVGQQSSKT